MNPSGVTGRRGHGFTLTEVVFAVGLLALALVPLFSLLPLALQHTADGKNQTRAALLAQSLFSELKCSPDNNLFLLLPSRGAWTPSAPLNLLSPETETLCVAYDAEETALGSVADPAYQQGLAGAAFFATVSCRFDTISGLGKMTLAIEWPAAAPLGNRHRQIFITWMNPKP